MIHPPQKHVLYKSTNQGWNDSHVNTFSNSFTGMFKFWQTNDYQYLLHRLNIGCKILMADGTYRVPNANEVWADIIQTNPPPTSSSNVVALNGQILDLPFGMPNSQSDVMDIMVNYPAYMGYNSVIDTWFEQVGATVYVSLMAEFVRVPIFRNEF